MVEFHRPYVGFSSPAFPAILSLAALAMMGLRIPAGYERSFAIRRGRRVYDPRETGSIAAGNRWGGEHKHEREIARRKRQAARRAA
jgi:hypothetical protein